VTFCLLGGIVCVAVWLQLIRDIVQIYKEHNLETRVLSASIRHPTHAFESAKAGAYAGTMPFKVGCQGQNSAVL
jgi:transaldolase